MFSKKITLPHGHELITVEVGDIVAALRHVEDVAEVYQWVPTLAVDHGTAKRVIVKE